MRRSIPLAVCPLLVFVVVLAGCAGEGDENGPGGSDSDAGLKAGFWRAWLESPGGELPFELLLERTDAGHRATVINGDERIEVPRVELSGGVLVLGFDQYDSRIEATVGVGGTSLEGSWTKRTISETPSRLTFRAAAGTGPRFAPPRGGSDPASANRVDGRWSVRFADDETPAIGLFASAADGTVQGTFLTTTGDYRYLAGDFAAGELRLSCFDGAHAFLFRARLDERGRLEGDFWSRDSYHVTWTAERDENAELPDAFGLTRGVDGVDLSGLVFPDIAGRPRSLGDPELAGPARIVEIFGSWCPNCNDATAYLIELHERYAERGLVVIGLAHELSGDFERDADQVRVYADHHDIPYTVLVAGRYGRDEASRSFPLIDRIRAFPTTIFLDASGRVRAVHTGFSGPATGDAHRRLREQFERTIETLLDESEG
jgi:thiol-disulfide isomerase/thioredoxin